MKYFWFFLVVIFAFAGCSRVDNSFSIYDPNGQVSKAELRLCGAQVELVRSNDRLGGKKSIRCEGEGDIALRLANGNTVLCHIGYITPDAEQRFSFELVNGRCLPKL
jgi:hypothetical protein